ncbi:hypothetical protein A605_11350 [Corynebacterium halotolerans YIM 70093 = DSM 44683]|uniref:Copper resistance protein D domain-containing protein n=1 Tax=Corynebacterium halotolerans YIM 70093 = DSM 44683 TaxID=1121362 RepID=M1P0G0_9CORY|nr:hypothetical protein A605_11350 [Corynebacterium halotolerans YIM 70093 = DSM 44683]
MRSTWPLYLLFFVVAGLIGATISYAFLTESLTALGIPDPGFVTTYGLPFFRAVGWMLAALAVGSFMFAAFYISPRVPEGDNDRLIKAPLSVDGHLASRTGAVSALCFGLVALLMIPLVLSDVSGTPFVQTLRPDAFGVALEQVATAQAWGVVAAIALVTGIVGLFLRNWASQPLLMLGAILMIVPLAMEGHSASGGDHDYGTNSYLWHLVFMVVWVGGLMALVAHGRRLGPDLDVALRRYSAVALFSIIVMAVSGLVNAGIRIEFSDWFTTRYGLIIVAKTVGVIVLGVFGWLHRAWTIPKVQANPHDRRLFRRVAIGEVLVMAAVTGVAITMGRTPPPPPRDPNLSPMAVQIGYELTEEPTFLNVWTMWRFDLLFGTIALLLAAGYLYAVWRARRAGRDWATSRTVWWLLGCASLVLTMSSGIGLNMPASYSMHMLGHMILSMVVPLFLVFGAPLTLLMTAFKSGPPGRPGIRDWAYAFTQSRLLRIISNPVVNLVQFLFFFYVMYLIIPLYELMISEHAGHMIMNAIFLVSGYFYFWEVVGPDPIPHRRPTPVRLAVLFVSMPVHLFLGVYLMQLNTVMGQEFYESLFLPWNPDLLVDQKEGGGIAWAFGSFPLAIVFARLALDWRREDKAETKVYDDKVARGEDDEFESYNQMLARMNAGGEQRDDYYNKEFGK